MKRILLSLVSVAAIATLMYQSSAFFSDVEVAANNTFTVGEIDLQIDSTAFYNGMVCQDGQWVPVTQVDNEAFDAEAWNSENLLQFPKAGTACSGSWTFTSLDAQKFFNYNDIKPGDSGSTIISTHIHYNDAWACMEFSNLENLENGFNEPESLVDTTPEDGELPDAMKVFAWMDNGNNIFEVGEKTIFGPADANTVMTGKYALADSTTGDGPFEGSDDPSVAKYIGVHWCVGEMTVDLETAVISCSEGIYGNELQTDGLTVDIGFEVQQARNNPDFECLTCEEFGDGWLSSVVSANQGLRKNGTAVLAARSNPNSMFGPADGGNPGVEGNFYSLGFGGQVTVGFNSKVYDQAGNDLSFFEVTNGRASYPRESAKVEVAQSASGPWVEIGEVDSLGSNVDELDFGTELPWIQFIKLTDTTDVSQHTNDADGYDVDAIGASNMCIDTTVL